MSSKVVKQLLSVTRVVLALSLLALSLLASVAAFAGGHMSGVKYTGEAAKAMQHHHHMTPEQYTELREKIPLYREFSDEQIMDSMMQMGPNYREYLSAADVGDNVGILALGHGFGPAGDAIFKGAYTETAGEHPTAMALGMAMMTSDHIQTAVDELTAAGADKVVVIPITTQQQGRLITQWRYIFGFAETAPWMSVPRVETEAEVVLGPTPVIDPRIAQILLGYAQELSTNPEHEVVTIIAHGPTDSDQNIGELAILADQAAIVKKDGNFADAAGFTLQDDAPSEIRAANVQKIRDFMTTAIEDGKRAIVVTTLPVGPVSTGSVGRKIVKDLDGIEYQLADRGVIQHPLFSDWLNSVIASSQ